MCLACTTATGARFAIYGAGYYGTGTYGDAYPYYPSCATDKQAAQRVPPAR